MLVLRGEFGLAKKPRSTFDNSPALPESLPDFNGCPSVNHGVYQITKELNTFTEEKKGKCKKKVYDYPQLNGDLNTLRTKLKEYYVSHIKERMFKYQLIK